MRGQAAEYLTYTLRTGEKKKRSNRKPTRLPSEKQKERNPIFLDESSWDES